MPLSSELITELLLVSLDAALSLILLFSYKKANRDLNSLQEINPKDTKDALENLSSEQVKYVVVNGFVQALSNNKIPSMHVPNTSGVVQKLMVNERFLSRTTSGLWWDESRPIYFSFISVPFGIVVDKNVIEVKDVQLASDLHLDTVYNNFDRTVHSLADNVWSFFFGVRHSGIQTTEDMLKEGTNLTVIGNLISQDGAKLIVPPHDKPYYITTKPLSTLITELRSHKNMIGFFLILAGGTAIVFSSMLSYRLYVYLMKRRKKQEMERRLEQNRRTRQRLEQEELPEHLRCVVCQDHQREVILLPCGHLCLCWDCSEQLTTNCPVCRSQIASKAAAFLS